MNDFIRKPSPDPLVEEVIQELKKDGVDIDTMENVVNLKRHMDKLSCTKDQILVLKVCPPGSNLWRWLFGPDSKWEVSGTHRCNHPTIPLTSEHGGSLTSVPSSYHLDTQGHTFHGGHYILTTDTNQFIITDWINLILTTTRFWFLWFKRWFDPVHMFPVPVTE